jgi:hypothetical protein
MKNKRIEAGLKKKGDYSPRREKEASPDDKNIGFRCY